MRRFKLLSKKGEGTFAIVYCAQDVRTGDLVAIKLMKQKFSSIREVNNLREVVSLRRLMPHPNVIQLKEILYDKPTGRLALVFSLMEMNLYDLIRGREKYLSNSLIRIYFFQTLQALAHMHRKGIFHRDIKPENILIETSYDVHTGLKLADFGSCRGIQSKQPFTEYISTRWYRAPECLLTDGYYSHAMDVWGVGCVMWEISSLVPLFPGQNEKDQIARIHKILGTPSRDTLGFFKKHKTRHMSLDFSAVKGRGLAAVTPSHVPVAMMELLSRMLTYDPRKRISAEDALQHPYFADLHKVPMPPEMVSAMAAHSDAAKKGTATAVGQGAAPAGPTSFQGSGLGGTAKSTGSGSQAAGGGGAAEASRHPQNASSKASHASAASSKPSASTGKKSGSFRQAGATKAQHSTGGLAPEVDEDVDGGDNAVGGAAQDTATYTRPRDSVFAASRTHSDARLGAAEVVEDDDGKSAAGAAALPPPTKPAAPAAKPRQPAISPGAAKLSPGAAAGHTTGSSGNGYFSWSLQRQGGATAGGAGGSGSGGGSTQGAKGSKSTGGKLASKSRVRRQAKPIGHQANKFGSTYGSGSSGLGGFHRSGGAAAAAPAAGGAHRSSGYGVGHTTTAAYGATTQHRYPGGIAKRNGYGNFAGVRRTAKRASGGSNKAAGTRHAYGTYGAARMKQGGGVSGAGYHAAGGGYRAGGGWKRGGY